MTMRMPNFYTLNNHKKTSVTTAAERIPLTDRKHHFQHKDVSTIRCIQNVKFLCKQPKCYKILKEEENTYN